MEPLTLAAYALAFLLVGMVFLVLCTMSAALVHAIRRTNQTIKNDERVDNGK